MPLAKFETLLKRTMGLDTQSIGRPMLERALQERCAGSAMDDLDAYWLFLQGSAAEQLQLIEAVIVPETWFFRNRDAFIEMAQLRPQRPIGASHPLRILSLPCSTGEEPYSIAMALLDAGMPPQNFHIDAIDISAQSIAIARRAVYGKNSFRGQFMEFRDRHFALNMQGYALAETVRQQVRFMQSNLFADDLLPGASAYDIIFCRNLLIYFDRPTQHHAITILTRRLAPDGLLFVGPAESALMMPHPLTPLRTPMTFAFRHSAAKEIALPPPPQFSRPVQPSRPVALRPPHATTNPLSAAASAPRPQEDLASAQLLADQGKLNEAASACEQWIKQAGASAAAYYLMGVIHDAAQRTQKAADCYRKALYLEPNHADAMAQLATLLQTQGDSAGAKLLQQRARRSTENKPS